MTTAKNLITILMVVFIALTLMQAEEVNTDWQISGNAMLDYYYVNEVDSNIENNSKTGLFGNLDNDNRSGFHFRRIYLTLEKNLSENLSTRLRFMMANEHYQSSQMYAQVKDAYLTWQYLDNHSITAGIAGSPAFAVLTTYWGYRLMEKSASDVFGIRSSRNFGLTMKGNFGDNKLEYHFAYGNGEGSKSEDIFNNDKLFALSLKYNFMDNLFLELYGDRKANNNYTEQGFLAYENKYFRTGAQYTYQNREGKDINLISAPFIIKMANDFTIVTRASRYDQESDISSKYLLGFDYSGLPQVQIMPNIMYMDYKEGKEDILSRLTVSYEF